MKNARLPALESRLKRLSIAHQGLLHATWWKCHL